jgi:hypothetical protein
MNKQYIINDYVIDLRNRNTRVTNRNPLTFVEVKKEKLNANSLAFLVYNDDNSLIPDFMNKVRELGLTISGDGSARTFESKSMEEGDIITIGLSEQFDVDFIKSYQYNENEKTALPGYFLNKDQYAVVSRLKKLATQKRSMEASNTLRKLMGFTPSTPTYYTLLAASVGNDILNKERKEVTNLNNRFCNCLNQQEVKTNIVRGSMIGSDFVKVNYDIYKIVKKQEPTRRVVVNFVEKKPTQPMYRIVVQNPFSF